LDGGERTGRRPRGPAPRQRAASPSGRGRRRPPRRRMRSGARAVLARALERRKPLREGGRTTAFRWLNGAGDGIPGLTLDLFGDVGVLRPYAAQAPGRGADAAMELLRRRALYGKARPRQAGTLRGEERAARAPAAPLRGEPVETVDVSEQGLRFRIRPAE